MTNSKRLTVFVVLLCLALHQSIQAESPAGPAIHFVSKVIDGDTLVLGNGQHVRLLGINAPELARNNKPGEAGGQAAYLWLKQQVERRQVAIRFDQQLKDRYGRLLAHVFTLDGIHINLALVDQGHAFTSIIPPNIQYSSELLLAQQAASNAALGLWGEPDYTPVDIDKALNDHGYGWKRMLAVPESVVDDRRRDRNFIRLIINDKADIRIPRNHSSHFPNMDTYVGQKLEIRGWISRRNGHFSILVRHPSALVRLEAAD